MKWKFKVRKRGTHGEQITIFLGNCSYTSDWYPPWRNELERENAKLIVSDLNAALKLRLAKAKLRTEGQS